MYKDSITAETTKEKETWLGMDMLELKQTGGIHTAKEIAQQPRLWKETRSVVATAHVFL